MFNRISGSLALVLSVCGCGSDSPPVNQPKKDAAVPVGAKGEESKRFKLAAFMLEGDERRPIDFNQDAAPYEVVISETETLICNGAIKTERMGNKIKVTISPRPSAAADPSFDGCYIRSDLTCYNDGNCSQTCLVRTIDGGYYCVCGNQ